MIISCFENVFLVYASPSCRAKTAAFLHHTIDAPMYFVFVLIDNSTVLQSKIQHGLCWIYMGMIQSTLLRPVGNVDPVRERNVKVDNMKHEVSL